MIQRGGGITRRHVISPNPKQRPIHLFPIIFLRILPQRPGDNRRNGTNPEEMVQGGIDLAGRVQSTGSYQSPDHAAAIHGSTIGAGEIIRLIEAANIVDVS